MCCRGLTCILSCCYALGLGKLLNGGTICGGLTRKEGRNEEGGMREVVTVQVGGYANYVGAHFWNFQVLISRCQYIWIAHCITEFGS